MAQTIANLQSLREILVDIQVRILPTAEFYCAGGAVRDTLLQKPVKDIDIYIRCPQGASWLVAYVNMNTDYDAEIVNDYEHLGKVVNVYGYSYPVQLIVLEQWLQLFELLKEFPCSISKVGMQSGGALRMDPEFISTVSIGQEVLYSAGCPWMYRMKMLDKFPEFTHRAVPVSQHFVAPPTWTAFGAATPTSTQGAFSYNSLLGNAPTTVLQGESNVVPF